MDIIYSDGFPVQDSKINEFKHKAWLITPDGKKVPSEIISEDELHGKIEYNDIELTNKDSPITPNFIEDHGTYFYSYEWQYYVPKYSSYDQYHFYKGSCSFANYTNDPVPLTYEQNTSCTSTWSFTGKVEAEAGFKVAILADMKAKAGIEVSTEHTSYKGETIGATITIPTKKTGYIYRYKGGQYSGGSGCWRKYKVYKATGQSEDMGLYYETGDAWGIVKVNDHWKGITVDNGATPPPI